MRKNGYLKNGKYVDLWTMAHFIVASGLALLLLPLGVPPWFLMAMVVLYEIWEHKLNGGKNVFGWNRKIYEEKTNAAVDIMVGFLAIILVAGLVAMA